MPPRRALAAVLAAIALAFLVARVLRGPADWAPPASPTEPGKLTP